MWAYSIGLNASVDCFYARIWCTHFRRNFSHPTSGARGSRIPGSQCCYFPSSAIESFFSLYPDLYVVLSFQHALSLSIYCTYGTHAIHTHAAHTYSYLGETLSMRKKSNTRTFSGTHLPCIDGCARVYMVYIPKIVCVYGVQMNQPNITFVLVYQMCERMTWIFGCVSSFLPSDRVLNNIGSICIYDGVRVCLTTQNSMQRQNATKQKRRERKNQHTNACMVPFIDFVVAKIFNKTNWLKLSHDFQLNSILFDSIETFECISIACIVDAVVAIVLPYKLYIVFFFFCYFGFSRGQPCRTLSMRLLLCIRHFSGSPQATRKSPYFRFSTWSREQMTIMFETFSTILPHCRSHAMLNCIQLFALVHETRSRFDCYTIRAW